MANKLDDEIADLRRDSERRGRNVVMIVGVVLIALGALLAFLGLTYEHPAQRLATKTVPRGAEYGLIAGGIGAAVLGLVVLVRAMLSRQA